MAAIGVTKVKIESSSDPHFETYIISAEKIPPYYTNIEFFMQSLPAEISMAMKKDYETVTNIIYKNLSYSTIIDQSSENSRAVIGNIIMKRRSQTSVAFPKQISIPVAFQLKSEQEGTSDFVSQLTLELYVRGIVITEYRLSAVNLIYRGDM